MSSIDLSKLRRLAGGINRHEAEWLMGTIRYAIDAGLDPLDVVARGSRDGKVIDERARAFARHLTSEELEWFADNGADLYTDVRRAAKRSDGRGG